MKQKMLVTAISVLLVGWGCSKTEPTTAASSGADYVSEQEQYVDSLQQDVSIDNPDAMLDDLNESVGDNSENAELVRLNSFEQATVAGSGLSTATTTATQ